MSKDPAFLFYSNDFLSGVMLMSDEQVGKYIRLLCLQHQKGHLQEKDMLKICKSYDEDIFCKFIKDDDGLMYNVRLDEEITKRHNYSKSRSANRKSAKKDVNDMNNICKSYVQHMENENEDVNINKDLNKKEKEIKNKFGEFKKVLLTNDEELKLKSIYGSNFDLAIDKLDSYIASKNKKYASHYAVMKSNGWVWNEVMKNSTANIDKNKSIENKIAKMLEDSKNEQ